MLIREPVDGTVQHLGEAPYWQGEGETVDGTPFGEATAEDGSLTSGIIGGRGRAVLARLDIQ